MESLNWLLGFLGAIVSIGVLVGAALLGWKILRSTIDLLRVGGRPSVWSLLYYMGVLVLIIVVVSVFIPLFFSSLAVGIRDSRQSAQDISTELNSWIIQSIDNAQTGRYGAFPTSAPIVPYIPQAGGGVPALPTYPPVPIEPYVLPAVTATQVWILPSPPPPTPVVIMVTPQAEPTMDFSIYNLQTPPPTPKVNR